MSYFDDEIFTTASLISVVSVSVGFVVHLCFIRIVLPFSIWLDEVGAVDICPSQL